MCIRDRYTPAAKKIQPFASVWYEIRVLWPNIKPIKSHTLSNEVLYILVSQEVAKIFEVKVGGGKGNSQLGQLELDAPGAGRTGRFFYRPPTLTFDIFAASWLTRLYSTSFERSDSYLKLKAVVWLLTGFLLRQSTLISYHTKANGCIFFALGVGFSLSIMNPFL